MEMERSAIKPRLRLTSIKLLQRDSKARFMEQEEKLIWRSHIRQHFEVEAMSVYWDEKLLKYSNLQAPEGPQWCRLGIGRCWASLWILDLPYLLDLPSVPKSLFKISFWIGVGVWVKTYSFTNWASISFLSLRPCWSLWRDLIWDWDVRRLKLLLGNGLQ